MHNITSRVRPVDCDPADVLRSDGIRRASEATTGTHKGISCRAIGLVNMSTNGTRLRRVMWIHEDDQHAHELALVLDEEAKLVESPRMLAAALSLANRYPVADAREVFEGDSASGVLGFRDQLLADDVVHITSKSGFLPAALLEKTLGGLRSDTLETPSQGCVPLPQPVQMLAGVSRAVGVGSDVYDAEINTEKIVRSDSNRFCDYIDDCEVEFTTTAYEGSTTSTCSAFRTVASDGDNLAFVESQDADKIALPRQDTLVVRDSTVRAERRLSYLVSFVCFGNLGNCTGSQLCRKSETTSDIIVDEALQGELVGNAGSKSCFSNRTASGVETLHSSEQCSTLLACRLELVLDRQFHTHPMLGVFDEGHRVLFTGGRGFLPGLKAGAFAPQEEW